MENTHITPPSIIQSTRGLGRGSRGLSGTAEAWDNLGNHRQIREMSEKVSEYSGVPGSLFHIEFPLAPLRLPGASGEPRTTETT